MGASGWDYRVPFLQSVEESLVALQEDVRSRNDYIWPWDDLGRAVSISEYLEELEEDEILPRPTSLTDLAAAKRVEEFWEEGTHSILDVERVTRADGPDEFAAIRPLTAQELAQVFGTERPTAADFDPVHAPGPSGPLEDFMGPRWSGRSLVIYGDDRESPVEVYFWGYSGD